MRTVTQLVAGLVMILLLDSCSPRISPLGPSTSTPEVPRIISGTFRTADGLHLPLRSWLPEKGTQINAVIVALHGFNDYSNAFVEPAPWLAARGIAFFAYDQRGFGAAPNAGMWPGTAPLIDDLRTMLDLVRTRHQGVAVYAMGVSMGAAVILAALGDEDGKGLDTDGVVLVGPAVWGRATMPAYQTWTLWLAAHTVPWLRLTAKNLDITPSDNVEMLRALSRDPLVIKETRVDAMWGLVNLMDVALEATNELDGPSLVLYGMRDEIIPANAAQAMLDRLPQSAHSRQRVAVYDAGFHMLLRDLQGKVVWHDIASWLTDSTAHLPSGADAHNRVKELADPNRTWQK